MIKIGILFGGPSREREISFIEGRTIYNNLNKSMFEPVPIFIDSLKNFILLDWKLLYEDAIRDFYPSMELLPEANHTFQIYIESLGDLSNEELNKIINKAGKRIELNELSNYFDMAFIALHGAFGSDGQIQGLLDALEIPYTGSGVKACSIGMDKAFQKKIMNVAGFTTHKSNIIHKSIWKSKPKKAFFIEAKNTIGFPMVVRPAKQGSSIGVAILDEQTECEDFQKIVDNAFFIKMLHLKEWTIKSEGEKENFIRQITDLRFGVGFPVLLEKKIIYHPDSFWKEMDKLAKKNIDKIVKIESLSTEQNVIIEPFIHGKEFSCIVVKLENGDIVSLPPTEILKRTEIFDYQSKYSDFSQQRTPIDLPVEQINQIRSECARLFKYLEFNTYARIDGFITINRTVVLNDPNTSSVLLPSSFIFHQVAEIGLNPSQFLTYIIRISLQERINTLSRVIPKYEKLLKQVDRDLKTLKGSSFQKKKVGVILGGYSSERNISLQSGRNIYEKLASSEKYEPIPIFLTGNDLDHQLYQIPIQLLLKDNADDIQRKIMNFEQHPVIETIKAACASITKKYTTDSLVFKPKRIEYEDLLGLVDQVFIAIHGRPGEDGQIQKRLDYLQIPYNGSNEKSSQITINKYKTLQILKEYGLIVTDQLLVEKNDYVQFPKETLKKIEKQFKYPFVAKPVDDGAAVKIIKTQDNLCSFLKAMFRDTEALLPKLAHQLDLHSKEEFPQKEFVLIEALITANGAKHFLETTTGLLTYIKDKELIFEFFEPTEIINNIENQNLEENIYTTKKQNITPARFSNNNKEYNFIAAQVKSELKKATQLLGIQGYATFDAFVRIFDDNRVETIIIEVNSLPELTESNYLFQQATINNYKPFEFIDKILTFWEDVNCKLLIING